MTAYRLSHPVPIEKSAHLPRPRFGGHPSAVYAKEAILEIRTPCYGPRRYLGGHLSSNSDPYGQIEYLERIADEGSAWAADQLCERASPNSSVVIEKALRKTWNGQYGEDQVTFCKARIFALYGKPDRAKASAPC